MRGGFGRPLRRAFAADVPPLLRRANQMLSTGDFAAASTAFEQLARAAEARGGPRAPFFYIQAGRTRVLAGQAASGVDLLQRGLGVFALRGLEFKATNVGLQVIHELEARGLMPEAQQVRDYLTELIPEFEAGHREAAASRRPELPARCPGCGAPLRPDEVAWADEATALCEYCGSPVHGA